MNVAGFYEESISNGDGWRAVLFVSGCPHHCKGCHNKVTWDKNYGEPFEMEKYLDSIRNNCMLKGVTLSGGEPFLYAKELIPFIKNIRSMGLDIWAYTGYTLEELLSMGDDIQEMLSLIDILVDGEFIEELKTDGSLFFRGSSNQRIIDLNKLREGCSINDSIRVYEEEESDYATK